MGKSRRRDILVDEDEMVAFFDVFPSKCAVNLFFVNGLQNVILQLLIACDLSVKRSAGASRYLLRPIQMSEGMEFNLTTGYHFEPKDIDDGVTLMSH